MTLMSRKTFRQNISLAWPLAMNAVLVQSMILVDLLMIAPLGEVAVSALGIAAAILAFLVGSQFALANGTQMIIARARGADDCHGIATALVAGGVISIGFSVLASTILITLLPIVVQTIIDSNEVRGSAKDYLTISIWLLLISALTQVLIAYFNGVGRTRVPLNGFLLEIPVNIIVSLVLIYGFFGFPAYGLSGAALGSLSAIFFRCTYLLWLLMKERHLPLVDGFKAFNFPVFKQHFGESAPIAANHIVLSGGMMAYQLLFAQLSVYAYAAITLVMPWIRLGSQFTNAWTHAAVITISQYRGSGDNHLIPDFLQQTVRVTFLGAALLSGFLFAFNYWVSSIYPAMQHETLLALAIIAPVYILRPFVQAYNTFCGHSLRALGESLKVLKLHIVCQWLISLPLLALLIYLQAPLLLVFSITLLEECLKTWFFRAYLLQKIEKFS